LRKKRGQAVYRVTAYSERLIDLLVSKGKLADDEIHTLAMIEQALTEWIDEEGRK
jgi:hypothetical protein